MASFDTPDSSVAFINGEIFRRNVLSCGSMLLEASNVGTEPPAGLIFMVTVAEQ